MLKNIKEHTATCIKVKKKLVLRSIFLFQTKNLGVKPFVWPKIAYEKIIKKVIFYTFMSQSISKALRLDKINF